jgi:hypothetical protein
MKALAALALSASLSWHLWIPLNPFLRSAIPSPLPQEAEAAEEKGTSNRWRQFGHDFTRRAQCEAERSGLSQDPVVGEQMRQGRCVEY